ncbi:hypothetical protein FE257_010039 [Aspergillus nanangensis]|uniref:Uncharacterized protein n=1 Tax=Aspergillus nanangensis TaxID=2582783 RepID=A0AAD4CW90_ASPNN|nr:hypothetical protein FE257_010039 [Aspergillus nanangensis]
MASVPSAAVFSLPLASWQQPPSARVARYEPKKRKKYSNGWGDDDDDYENTENDDYLDGETTDAASEIASTAPSLTLAPDEAHQYRVAGLSFDKELPGGNFPHAPVKDKVSRRGRKDILRGLSSLSSPIYPPQSAAHQGNLRFQHFAALSSVLHRCLFERDFVRAGRAWGLILREEFRGIPLDVRTESRWGIGAEILFRRDRQIADSVTGTGPSRLCFTRKGFEEARQYYERLVVQHPYRKAAPHAISSLHFYPAMFGLWIFVVQEESTVTRQDIEDSHEESPDVMSEDEDAPSSSESHHESRQRRHHLIAEVRKVELDEAQKIAARIDEVLMSPPYSDSSELLQLRGMVSLWVADLLASSVPYEERGDPDADISDPIPGQSLQESIQLRRAQRLGMDRRQSEKQKAAQFFEKAKERGRGMASTLNSLHIGDDIHMSD